MASNLEFISQEFETLKFLDKCFKLKMQKLQNNNFVIQIDIDKSKINIQNLKENIKFFLFIKNKHPISHPNLYCLTKFCNPEICDARDLLDDVLPEPWGKKATYYPIKQIIEYIPNFINNYLKKPNSKIGKFYLDNIYENDLLSKLPSKYYNEVIEKVYFENSEIYYDEPRKLFITDGYFLLFVEKGAFDNDKMILIFWASINSLSHIKRYTESNIIVLTWKLKGGRESVMLLGTNDSEKIVKLLTDILKKRSIKYKVTNKNLRPKEGEIPNIPIDSVEEEINTLEVTLRLKENINKKNVQRLMNLYEQAVHYYSAINNDKYETFISKIQEMFSNDEYSTILNQVEEEKIDEEEKETNVTETSEEKKEEKTEDNSKEEKKEEESQEKAAKTKVEGNIKKSDLDFGSDSDDDD